MLDVGYSRNVSEYFDDNSVIEMKVNFSKKLKRHVNKKGDIHRLFI